MKCPKCDGEMEKVEYHQIEVDRCTWCRGLWFDMLEHEHLKKLVGAEAIDTGDADVGAELDEKRNINCPVCKTPMIRMAHDDIPGLHYEACTTCYGVFFDAGEFKQFKEEQVLGAWHTLFHSI